MTTGKRAVRIALTTVFATALMLVGWGVRDAAGFFASFARSTYLIVVLMGMTLASLSVRDAAKKGSRTPAGQKALLATLQSVTLALAVFLPFNDRREILAMQVQWVRWLGVMLVVCGFAISVVALRTLGKNYSVYVTIQEQHRLVQEGIYGVVRNPIYLGNLLSWPGACLVFRSWLFIPVFTFFLLFAVLRGLQEERVLREEFESEFDVYCRRTWRLVPYVY